MADYDPDESYIRQGSDREKNMKVWDVFAEVADMLDFVDPNTLEVGKTYAFLIEVATFSPISAPNISLAVLGTDAACQTAGAEPLAQTSAVAESDAWATRCLEFTAGGEDTHPNRVSREGAKARRRKDEGRKIRGQEHWTSSWQHRGVFLSLSRLPS